MKNKYQLLEELLIKATKDLSFNWEYDKNSKPFAVTFTTLSSKTKNENEYVNIIFGSEKYNELIVHIRYVKDEKTKREVLILNMDKVPNLMEHLSITEYSFQINTRVKLDDRQFQGILNKLNKVLVNGELNNKKAVFDTDIANLFSIGIDKNKTIKVKVKDIDYQHLGFQVLSVEISEPNNEFDYPLGFQKFIPIHNLKKMPFLNSIAKVPKSKRKELNPDIDSFINSIAELNCKQLTPLALSVQLENEMNFNNVKNKINKNKKI